jgi:hypothetical protein
LSKNEYLKKGGRTAKSKPTEFAIHDGFGQGTAKQRLLVGEREGRFCLQQFQSWQVDFTMG